MFRYTSREEIVSKLFDSAWLCETTKLSLSLIEVSTTDKTVCNNETAVCGGTAMPNGVIRTEKNPNEEGILDMLLGRSRNSVGMEFYTSMGITPVEVVQLSTAALAELVYNNGGVKLINAADAVKIYEDIGTYLNLIQYKEITEVHFQPPPPEDIAAFTALYKLIEGLASSQNTLGQGETPFNRLSRLSVATATEVNNPLSNASITFNGKNNVAHIGPNYEKSPYTF